MIIRVSDKDREMGFDFIIYFFIVFFSIGL